MCSTGSREFQGRRWRFERAPSPLARTSPQFRIQLAEAVKELWRAGIGTVVFVHGTFLGNDVCQWALALERLSPSWAGAWRRAVKYLTDAIMGDRGNYPMQVPWLVQQAAQGQGVPLRARRFCWSGENTHTARADAAVRLLPQLATWLKEDSQDVLLVGHSHGGNVLALLAQAIQPIATVPQWPDAVAPLYRGRAGQRLWQEFLRAREELRRQEAWRRLWLVTLGTPVRYAWPDGAQQRLLHLLFRTPGNQEPRHLEDFRRMSWNGAGVWLGDVIQQLGTSGSNFPPGLPSLRMWRAEWKLAQCLEPQDRWLLWWKHLTRSPHWPRQGQLLVVDYGTRERELFLRGLLGHAAYTRIGWLPWHLEQWAQWVQQARAKQHDPQEVVFLGPC